MKEKVIRLFHSDKRYQEEVKKYYKIDGILAVVLFVVLYIAYYYMGRVYTEKNIYLGNIFSIGCIILTLLFTKLRGQKLHTLGITKYNLKRASITGAVIGIVYLLVGAIIPGIIQGFSWLPMNKIMYNIFYYFIIIGFMEEIVFRGYIQTRLHGFIKNEVVVTIVSGLFFALMHIPFQMAIHQMSTIPYILDNIITLIILVLWHVVFTFLYKKYNSLVAGTFVHGFMDLCMGLFQ